MSKIYFAGSIRGGRADAELYRKMINYMQQTDDVLTEHVGDLSLSMFEGQGNAADRLIYEQDTKWLKECDYVVAECTVPSLGVGYELCFAEKYGKPVHIFYRKSVSDLSAMLAGDTYFKVYRYESWEDLKPQLDEVLGK